MEQLIDQARADAGGDDQEADLTRGTLISKFSFAIDVREWGFRDPWPEMVRQARNQPVIRQIAESDVWDERNDDRESPAKDRSKPFARLFRLLHQTF